MKFRKKLALVLLALLIIFFVLYLIMGESLTRSSIGAVWFVVAGITLAVGFISEIISLVNSYKK